MGVDKLAISEGISGVEMKLGIARSVVSRGQVAKRQVGSPDNGLGILLTLYALLLMTAVTPTFAGPVRHWRQDVHYTVLEPRPKHAIAAPIEVLELFWFQCPFCNEFEPYLLKWIATHPPDVVFRRVPVTWDRAHRVDAQLFCSLDALNRRDLYQEVYDSYHKHQHPLFIRRDSDSQNEVLQAEFASSHGIEQSAFLRMLHSPAVTRCMADADANVIRFKIAATPTLVIDGRYATTLVQAGSGADLIGAAQYLIYRARLDRGRSSGPRLVAGGD